ncbi:hypothetical protein Tco_1248466, partial [Tanacetum coccineum]
LASAAICKNGGVTFKPRTLNDTYCLANLQEAINESRAKSKPVYSGYKIVASTSFESYGEVYVSGHKCSGQMFVLEVLVEDGEEHVKEDCFEECLSEDINPGSNGNAELQTDIRGLLEEFEDVFAIPNCLSPKRSLDHKIPLKEEVASVNIRPYRYPPAQKDTIETMVQKLLDLGVIRQSNSPLSYPIMMVKKKDGSWRMCVDYMQLN